MFILGANHPSAILHNHGKENDSNLATTICLAIAAISFAQRELSTGFVPFLDDAKKAWWKVCLDVGETMRDIDSATRGLDRGRCVQKRRRVFKTPYGCRCGYQRRERRLAWFNQEFTHLHNVEMEDVRVQSSFKTFIELFRGADGKLNEELLLGMFKIKSLMSRLGKSETSKDYLVSFKTFIDEFCIGAANQASR